MVPVVIYNGRDRWTVPRSLEEMFSCGQAGDQRDATAKAAGYRFDLVFFRPASRLNDGHPITRQSTVMIHT